MNLEDGYMYEAELIEMGRDEDGNLTADDESWFDGQTYWNIWVVLRDETDETGEHHSEILDLDIPVELQHIALALFNVVARRVEVANRQRLTLD